MIARIAELLRRLGRNEKGNVLLIAGAALTGMVGAAGIGVDTVQWYLWKRQMQQAVDTGAVAGALMKTQGLAHSAAVTSEITRTANTAYVLEAVNTPPLAGSFTGDASAIEVIATTSASLPFSSVFLAQAPTIRTRAVARAVAVGEPCVIGLADSGTGVEVFGSATVSLDCPVASNSPGGVSIDFNGGAYLDTDLINSVGGIDYTSTNIPADTAVVSYGLPVEDPLASRGLTPPSNPSACHANNYRVNPSDTETLPGGMRWCNGLTIQGTAYLDGGVYIIDGGDLKINSGAEVYLAGTGGVTFILTGNTASTIAEISINGSATIDIAAPTSAENATWAGILFYQDPLGPATHTINGGADIDLEGIIYMPKGDVTYNGDASADAQCLLLITERVRFGGTNNIENNCNTDVDSVNAVARVVRVVE